ncbi:ribonuclease III [Candidatus Marinamargulisbacteria bacterium SCGC AG-410-N11]|nr:ribonuclease III [Candidatus Marinamargulisbacteria bacterium SCGC AG-410-N11]
MTSDVSLDLFEKHANLNFVNKDLLRLALTHSSYANISKKDEFSNERLEFFGDAVLKLIISEYLYFKYPKESEGYLSKLRSKYVSDKLLSLLADEINLGNYLLLSFGEEKSGGAKRLSNLANAFEALLGAFYLDQGLDVVRRFLLDLIKKVETLDLFKKLQDYKSDLQEYLQHKKLALPEYRLLDQIGPDHDRQFVTEVSVVLNGESITEKATGTTKKDSEQVAACKLLAKLHNF